VPRSDLAAQPRPANRLLAALPRREYERLLPFLEPAPLEVRVVLQEPAQPIAYIHFPCSGIISLLSAPQRSGGSVEVGVVGREGIVGLPVFLGVEAAPVRWLVQVPGDSLRMPSDDFRTQVGRSSQLHGLLLRYTHAFMNHLALSLACNTLHAVEQRLARWLLLVHSMAEAEHFPLTHEFLAAMLGVRRASVSKAAKGLQEASLIRYWKGQLTVLDRAGLESASCGCHRAMQAELDGLPR
jgi:CRP-like cAMP-binding protein